MSDLKTFSDEPKNSSLFPYVLTFQYQEIEDEVMRRRAYLRDMADMVLYREQESISSEIGDKIGLQYSLGNQAMIRYDCGDLTGAMVLRKEQESLCREIGNRDGLHVSVGGQGLILYDLGDLEGAMAKFREQQRLCQELGNPEGISIALANQARILGGTRGSRREARRLAAESVAIAIRHGYKQLIPVLQRVRDSVPVDEE